MIARFCKYALEQFSQNTTEIVSVQRVISDDSVAQYHEQRVRIITHVHNYAYNRENRINDKT